MARYAPVRKVQYDKATCQVEIDWRISGSVLKGDVEANCLAVRTTLRIESPAPADKLAGLVAMAKRGCFMEQMITTAVPVTSTLVVNSEEVPIPPHPGPR